MAGYLPDRTRIYGKVSKLSTLAIQNFVLLKKLGQIMFMTKHLIENKYYKEIKI